jgi:cytochrome b subunit of formate dehydrogenase
MNRNFRIAHWGVILSFPTLVFTGFALKYPEAWWARPMLLWEGISHFVARCIARRPLFSRFHHLPRDSSRHRIGATACS